MNNKNTILTALKNELKAIENMPELTESVLVVDLGLNLYAEIDITGDSVILKPTCIQMATKIKENGLAHNLLLKSEFDDKKEISGFPTFNAARQDEIDTIQLMIKQIEEE